MYPVFAAAVGAIATIVIFAGLFVVFIVSRFRHGSRNPESPASNSSVLSQRHAERAFEKPRDESDLL